MRPGYPWREFGVLVGAGLVGVLLVLPYQLALLPAPPIPLPVLVLAAFVQSAILLAVATGLGLAAARRVGLGAPFVEASLYGGDSRAALRALQLPLAAVLFGLGHLPATAALLPLTPAVVARAVVLNGIAGVVFGWLYWRRGLEAAMVAHFCADLVLHVLFGG